jgi:hypothetical protein
MIKTVTKPETSKFLKSNKPEIELLLACARSQVNDITKNKINFLIKQDINWKVLIEIAHKHGLIPLLFDNLNKLCRQSVPQDIFSDLEQYFQAHVRRNLLLTSELLKILELFTANNIQAISFKGPTLAIYAYGNLVIRQFCDLDILVQKQDISKITELLISLGYKLPSSLAEVEEKPYLQYQNFLESKQIQRKYDFIHSQKKIAIDLQWYITEKRLNSFFSLDFQHLKSNSQLISLAGSQVVQFSLENLLLYLCFHGSKHCWSELKWVCDVAELIQNHPEIDWQKVEEQAKKINCERMLYLGLWLAYDLLQADIPESIIASIRQNQTVQWLAQQSQISIFEQPLKEINKYIFIANLKNSMFIQFAYLTTMLLTPTAKEWEYLKLPKSLRLLYFFIRPYRLFVNYIGNK